MADHPELRVRLSRRTDGGAVLHCDRRDGSSTWQRHSDRQARFFGFHDLTHFAVETTVGARQGFFGLLAAGWDIADADGKGARGPLPSEAIRVEHLVGLLDRERIGGSAPLTAGEVNDFLTQLSGESAGGHVAMVTEAMLTTMRVRMQQLHSEWAALPVGSTLELSFDRTAFSRTAFNADSERPSQTA